jgi:acyl carrier protein phosphodiesterase
VNHLAHFHLAGECEHLVLGALLGDYVKGPLTGALPHALERGVKLHRRVDAFTDGHERLRALRVHFGPGERRLAGVVTDLFFDYLLTRHWEIFHVPALRDFSTRVYAILERHVAALPPPAARQARRIVEYDLLCRYGEAQVLDGTLQRLGEVLRQPQTMRAATAVAWSRIGEFEAAFLDFYPQLIEIAGAPEFRP